MILVYIYAAVVILLMIFFGIVDGKNINSLPKFLQIFPIHNNRIVLGPEGSILSLFWPALIGLSVLICLYYIIFAPYNLTRKIVHYVQNRR